MSVKHTPGPLKVLGDDECPEDIPVIEIIAGECGHSSYKQIAYVQPSMNAHDDFELTEEDRANAEFIVRACNSHDELVEALENLTAVIMSDDAPVGALTSAVMDAKRVLSKARASHERIP